MVFVVRQTALNQLPFPVCVYTDLASTCVETYGPNMNFFVPGDRLVALTTSDNLLGNPLLPYNEVIQQVPYVPGQPLVPYNPYSPYVADPNGLLVLVQTFDGEIFYHYERERWSNRRVRTIFIVDPSYNPYLLSSNIGGDRCGRGRGLYGGIDSDFIDEEFIL